MYNTTYFYSDYIVSFYVCLATSTIRSIVY